MHMRMEPPHRLANMRRSRVAMSFFKTQALINKTKTILSEHSRLIYRPLLDVRSFYVISLILQRHGFFLSFFLVTNVVHQLVT
jgi:hypothetical protein